jgi:hypothetical protein
LKSKKDHAVDEHLRMVIRCPVLGCIYGVQDYFGKARKAYITHVEVGCLVYGGV